MGRRHFRESIDVSEPSQATSVPSEKGPETSTGRAPEVAPAPVLEDHSALADLADDEQTQYHLKLPDGVAVVGDEETLADGVELAAASPRPAKKPKRRKRTKAKAKE